MKWLRCIIVLLIPHFTFAQIISTFCGNGTYGVSSENVPATATHIGATVGGVFDGSGNYYFSQGTGGQKISKVSFSGIMTTVAGTGVAGYSGDGGAATLAKLNYPNIVTIDKLGNIYIPDGNNNVIRRVNAATGIITTIAGTGTSGFNSDGLPATATMLNVPSSLGIDRHGNLCIADYNNNRIRRIDNAGNIYTIAGTGINGFSGDGGPATAAKINGAIDIKFDTIGNLYIADQNNGRIRKIDTFGIITTVAGNGTYTYSGDEIPATNAQFGPQALTIDHYGNIFIADISNNRIRYVDNSGIIHHIAGTGVGGYNGDGIAATIAQVNLPAGLVSNSCGDLYIDDNVNYRIRRITTPVALSPSVSFSGILSAVFGTPVTVTATLVNPGSSYLIHWINKGVEFTTTTGPSVTYTKGLGTDTITAIIVSVPVEGCSSISAASTGYKVVTQKAGISIAATPLRYIYPNPTNDLLHIDNLQTASTYRVFNMVGSVMQQGNLKGGNNSISVQMLPAGMYMLEIAGSENNPPLNSYGGQRRIYKIIKE